MKNAITSMRWLLSAPIILLTLLLLIGASILGSVSIVLHDSDSAKAWLNDAHFYENAISTGLDIVFQRVVDAEEGADVASKESVFAYVSQEDIREEAMLVFPVQWVQGEAEEAIDAFYAYLEGEASFPDITISIGERSEVARNSLARLMKKQLHGLPRCGDGSVVSEDEFHLFFAQCLPQDFSIAKIEKQIDEGVRDLAPMEEVFGQSEIRLADAAELDVADLEHIRALYRYSAKMPFLMWAFAVVGIGILFAAVPGAVAKERVLVVLFSCASVVSLVIVIALYLSDGFLFGQIALRANLDMDTAQILQVAQPVAQEALQHIAKVLGIMAFLYAGMAGGIHVLGEKRRGQRLPQ